MSRVSDWFWRNTRDPILNDINDKLDQLIEQGGKIMSLQTDLHDAVSADTDVVSSAVTLLQGLAAKLDAALQTGDPAAIQAEIDAIKANSATLAAAVAANTR